MTNVESSPEMNGLGDYMQKVFIWNVNMPLTGRGMNPSIFWMRRCTSR